MKSIPVQYFLIVATFLSFLAIGYTTLNQHTMLFGAAPFSYNSNEARILRYLGKMEVNRGNPVWDNARAVKDFQKPDGSVDYDKARQKFIDQEIMSGETFDTTVAALRASAYINNPLFKATGKGITAYQEIQQAEDERIAAELAEAEQKRLDDINNPTTTPQ